MITLANRIPLGGRVCTSRVQESTTTASTTSALARIGAASFRQNAGGSISEALNQVRSLWERGEFSVLDHVDFHQMIVTSLGERGGSIRRGLQESAGSYAYSDAIRGIHETLSSDHFNNLLTTVIRYGAIEAAQNAPTPLMTIVNTSLRLVPGQVDLPIVRTPADLVDDGVDEWEMVQYKGVPAPNMLRLPKAKKKRLAFRMSREMLAVDAIANQLIRSQIDAQGEAFNIHAEKQLSDAMFGLYDTATASANPYPYILDGIQLNTFQTSGSPWKNDVTGAALDGTQVPFEMLEKTIEAAVDPYSGEPADYARRPRIVVNNKAAAQFAMDALGVLRLIRDTTSVGGSARQELDRAAGSSRFGVGDADIVISRYIRPRLEAWLQTTAGGSNNSTDAATKAGTTWLYGDTERAFAFATEWDRETLTRSGTDTQQYFNDQTIYAIQWIEKTTPAVVDPIRVIRLRSA